MKQLLPAERFEPLFLPMQGKRVGYVKMHGNVGDRLIDWATEQLFEHFGIVYGTLNWMDGPSSIDLVLDQVDMVVVAGGGNLGGRYDNCRQLRRKYLTSKIPTVVLPQTCTDLDEPLDQYQCIYLRENESLSMFPKGIPAPDLALGFMPPKLDVTPDIDVGIFIREDPENEIGFLDTSLGDPALICDSVMEYLALAARCRTIYTDRLHFAICGLIAERDVHLLPGDYFKNRSVYETWLQELGCHWCEDVKDIPDIPLTTHDHLFKSLALPAGQRLSWESVPTLSPDIAQPRTKSPGRFRIIRSMLELPPESEQIIELVNDSRNLGEIAVEVAKQSGGSRIDSARDVQYLLKSLRDLGLARLHPEPFRTVANKAVTNDPGHAFVNPEYYELSVEPPCTTGHTVRHQACLKLNQQEAKVLWFESADLEEKDFSPMADAFLLVSLLPAMLKAVPLYVTGAPVSAGLMENLQHYQRIFNLWYPSLTPIDVIAETGSLPATSKQGIAAFSGGVDSAFSVLHHRHLPPSQRDFELNRVLMVRGFDMIVSSTASFGKAVQRAELLLKDEDCEIVSVNTNAREFYSEWQRSHGLCIAAALSLFNHQCTTGMLASTLPYKLLYPFGSNAVTDPLLGSDHFQIAHHGAEFSRFEKLEYLSSFPNAIRHIRFCWENLVTHQNCGRCDKCIVTAILLTALELPLSSFESPPATDDYRNVLDRFESTLKAGSLDYHDLMDAIERLKSLTEKPQWFDQLDTLLLSIKDKHKRFQ